VRLDVLVQERGRAVTGLTRGQFRLWDNDREQRVDVLSTEALPVDLVVVYDTSGSVEGDTQGRLRSATQSVVAMLRSQDVQPWSPSPIGYRLPPGTPHGTRC
jgi:Mg-chelatase subunit ChlD